MTVRSLVWAVVAAVAAFGVTGAAEQRAPDASGRGRLVLDESAYCRPYYQFGWERLSSRVLKAEGEKLLGRRGLKRLERAVKARLADLKIDWSQHDWRDRAVFRGFRMGGTGDVEKCRAAYTDPPPAGWADADFDDGRWLRFRRPFAVGDATGVHFGQWRCQGPGLQAAYFRYRFVVTDPGQAGDVTLSLSYYGGARAFINGRELARGHLPAGAVTADTVADDYPLGAYRRLYSELSDKEKDRAKRKGWVKGDDPPQYFGNVGHMVGPGSRVYNLRNRRLGPVKVPARLLRKGANVLAVELRAAPLHPAAANAEWLGTGQEHSCAWLHARLTRLSLGCTGGAVASALTRPGGVQVWAEDMNRRVFSPEYLDPGQPRGAVEIVGGPNGTYAAQVVVGTDRDLTGVKVTPGDLEAEAGGAVIPASAVRVLGMVGHPIGGMIDQLGQGRIPVFRCAVTGREPPPVRQALLRFAGGASAREAGAKILYFDHLSRSLPPKIPAGSCRPYWLSLRIPRDAAPGSYRGRVRVEMPGAAAAEVPVAVEVVGWRVPDPGDLQVNLAVEQSPYAVARQYKVRLWSKEHFRLIEASLAQFARVGNDWWFVPVVLRTEFGNGDDSMIRWVRAADGGLGFDYAILDRYLDLIETHCGRPRVVSFVVMHGTPKSPIEVMVLNAATGRPGRVRLGGREADPVVRRTYWAAFANDLYRHMKARGLDEAMHWGYAWDTEGDPKIKPLLAAVVPEVRWTSGSHNTRRGGSGGGGRLDTSYYKSTTEIYSFALSARSRMGWKQTEIRLNTPRIESSCACIEGHSTPFGYRLAVDRALVAGFNGLGRIGGDYWAKTYWSGMRGSEWNMAGFPILTVLWPGPAGAEPSQRLEAIIEGLQETEARIFIEQALDRSAEAPEGRKLLPADTARRLGDVLFGHNRQTLSLPTHVPANLMNENAQGWLDRSRRLYAAAAEAAAIVGLDVAQTAITKAVAPYGRPEVAIRLRNWTARPRAWRAAADRDWLRLEKTQGSTTGFEELTVRIDAARLAPETAAVGTVTVTDLAAGRSHPVVVTAKVGKVFDFPAKLVMNVAPGESARQEGVALFNNAAVELPFKVTSPAGWIEVAPAGGKIPAGNIAFLKVLVRAPREPGAHRAAVEVQVGEARKQSELTAHVIPPYRQPAMPAGKAVWLLEAVGSKAVKTVSHTIAGMTARTKPKDWRFWWVGAPLYNGHNLPGGAKEHMVYDRDRNQVPYPMGGRTFRRGYWAFPRCKTVYRIEGSGFAAFSAWAGFNRGMESGHNMANRAAVVNCEIYVDGRLRTQSGLLRVGDKPRLLVVDGLAGAKELALVTRTAGDQNDLRALVTWGDPTFYRKP